MPSINIIISKWKTGEVLILFPFSFRISVDGCGVLSGEAAAPIKVLFFGISSWFHISVVFDEEDFNVAFDQAVKRFRLIKIYKASPLDNLSVTITWFKAHIILLANPTFKKHQLSFTSILKNYIRYLPNDIKKSVKKYNLQNNSNILTTDLLKQLFDQFSLFDDNPPEINDPQKMVNFYSLLSKRYKETTNAYNDFKFEVNSFELLLYLYLKWFYEKQKNINYCLFCGRFYIPSAKSQKTCHYPKYVGILFVFPS